MKICVVGGTGNISASFVRLLLERGHEVTCYNRGQRGGLPAGAKLIVGDRQDRDTFERTMQAAKFDAAIDMICFNALDAQSSLRAFREVGQFVMCSTVCTYGVDYDWLPVTEDHPLRPITGYGQGKVAADNVFLEAFHHAGFPVTIIKPSTTYGPAMGMLRQVAWEFTWIDRIRQGKPILVCGDGETLHQFMHVDDAALAFAGVIGNKLCLGQTYNMVHRGFATWATYHRTAMKVIGREVELVGCPFETLKRHNIPRFGICADIFAHNTLYSADKLFRHVPGFQPRISLEQGLSQVYEAMLRTDKVPSCQTNTWEDVIIEAQKQV